MFPVWLPPVDVVGSSATKVSTLLPFAGQAAGDAAEELVRGFPRGRNLGLMRPVGVAEFLKGARSEHADQQVGILNVVDQPLKHRSRN
ncbi:MAG: hypothetical protein N2C14_13385 [Planctomycetales bacterium]